MMNGRSRCIGAHYYTMEGRSRLEDRLLSLVEISRDRFLELLPEYRRYGHDPELGGYKYLAYNALSMMDKGYPIWLVESGKDLYELHKERLECVRGALRKVR